MSHLSAADRDGPPVDVSPEHGPSGEEQRPRVGLAGYVDAAVELVETVSPAFPGKDPAGAKADS